mmetsp:Transcript_10042/g.19323  ORF Transcript_10042/g.19323 Transcript_10042/m.19323 type:complete len:129 (+) Transcript_10042:88-474(+)
MFPKLKRTKPSMNDADQGDEDELSLILCQVKMRWNLMEAASMIVTFFKRNRNSFAEVTEGHCVPHSYFGYIIVASTSVSSFLVPERKTRMLFCFDLSRARATSAERRRTRRGKSIKESPHRQSSNSFP